MAWWVVRILALVVLMSASPAWADESPPLRQVHLQLKWLHQFQSAGFYAAIEQGYYREAGLQVELLEGQPDRNPSQSVMSGEAEFGVGNSGLIVERAHGRPLVAVAVIVQHSPFVLLARGGADISTVHDLAGHTLMLEEHAHELLAYLALEKVPLEVLKLVPYAGDWQRLGRDVDALTAYTTSEPFDLQRAGVPYRVFNPRASGIDFYGDTLFTSEAVLQRDPALVAAMRAATIRGWIYALNHVDEMIDLIRRRYAPDLDREKLAFEAREIRRLMIPDMVAVGYMYEGRWRHIADGFAAAGLMPRDFPLDGFLYQPDARPDLRWLYAALAGALTVILIVVAVLLHVHRLNLRLRTEIDRRRRLEQELRVLASTDSLTGVANRRHWLDLAEREIGRARRQGEPLAVLVMDLDFFKAINDAYGHAVGDRVLVGFAQACCEQLRGHDSVGRMGGEEFCVLLPATDRDAAAEIAERIRHAATRITVPLSGEGLLQVSVSIGVASVEAGDPDIDAALARADAALYRAKQTGRNRVCMAASGA